MYAVIVTGGKQYRVREGDFLRVERLDGEQGDTVEFDRVLVVGGDDGVRVGRPYLEGGRVSGTVAEQGKGRKIKVVKFKRRKNYLRVRGHRQAFTRVKITSISAG